MKLSLIQITVGSDYQENLKKSKNFLTESLNYSPDFILFPECFLFLSNKNQISFEMNHDVILFFQEFAKKSNVNLLLGSLQIKENDKLYNRSIVINSNGNIISQYDKIHMFDIVLKNNEIYKESDTYTPGRELKTFRLNNISMGHSICYDLRFPKLYRNLAKKGSKVIVIPSAFTYTTGCAHWHTLVRARAIENGVYIVAPNQWGINNERRSTYGHSMVVNPWGEIIAEAEDSETILNCEIDISKVEDNQRSIPVLEHEVDFL